MEEDTDQLEILKHALKAFAGIDEATFELSRPFWQLKQYGKGEFYNAYKNVCKHMGFILDGVFRTYYISPDSGEEKNVFFFSKQQIVVSYKSYLEQLPCNYYTESMTNSTILYINKDNLDALYKQSHAWETFGRLVAEKGFQLAMARTEDVMFLTPEQRYTELMKEHPDIFNTAPLYHIASYLGIQAPSLSRIRKRMTAK